MVVAVLVWWHFVGANTSDDGYILTMARVSEHAGYMANYYRWFGTPEAPFGWYYDLLALWAHVSTASVWVRLPTLVMALACWWIISREVIPRLGHAVKTTPAAAWTAAGMFLAFWLPLNNGLRPEPIIALGILLTWSAVERGVATSRLLPVAIACIIGALTLFSGPTGIASVGALLVAVGPLRTILHRRSRQFGLLPLLAPILAAATVTIILIFRDQTLVGEVQANTFKSAVGPSLSWFDEHIRYERLFMASPDGSVARRFAVLALLVALAVSVAMTLRKGRIPGTAGGPSRRIIGITIISFLAMMFTPTKWTHHFGVFAGLAGSLGALAAVAVTAHAMRSRRNRAVFAAAVLFMTALSFASVNGWWYVSNFGVPWSNQFPEWHFGFTTLLLGLTVLVLLVAAWFHFSGRDNGDTGARRWWSPIVGSPLAVVAWLLVVFEVLSLTLGMTDQYPAWTVGRSNLEALTGKTCGLANDVLVEQDPNAGLLSPIGVPVGEGAGRGHRGRLHPRRDSRRRLGRPGDGTAGRRQLRRQRRRRHQQRGGHRGRHHRRRRHQRLQGPAAVRPRPGPHAGDGQLAVWRAAAGNAALGVVPAAAGLEDPPLLVVSAAGRFDQDEVQVQWATDEQAAENKPGGGLGFGDVGAAPAWRNLRAPLAAIPRDCHPDPARRLRRRPVPAALDRHHPAAHPASCGPCRTSSGRRDPVLLDWLVGLAFPCQRPFGHQNGVIEVPKWRILPDRFGAEANSPVMDNVGGGPLGISELLFRAVTVPTYLKDDWFRDWGALQRLNPFYPERRAGPAGPRHRDPQRAVESGAAAPDVKTLVAGVQHGIRNRLSCVAYHRASCPRHRHRPDRAARRRRRGHRWAFCCAGSRRCCRSRRPPPPSSGHRQRPDGTSATSPRRWCPGHRRHSTCPSPARRSRRCPPPAAWCSRPSRPAVSTPAATGCSSGPTPTPSSSPSVTRSPRSRRAPAVAPGACSALHIWANVGGVGADFVGIPGATGTLSAEKKPQVAGIFTDLKVAAAAGPVARASTSTPGSSRRRPPLKLAVMVLGVSCVLASIVALAVLDRRIRPAGRSPAPGGACWRVGLVDVAGRRRRHRHPAALARHRRDLVGRRLQPDHRAGVRRGRLHRQLLPLLRRHRGAVRLVPVGARPLRVDQHRGRLDAAARHRRPASAPG